MSMRATVLNGGRRLQWQLSGQLSQRLGTHLDPTYQAGSFTVVDNVADNKLFFFCQSYATQKRFAKAIHRRGKTEPYKKRLYQSILHPVMPEDVPERDWWRCRGMSRPIDYKYSEYRDNELDGLQQVVLRITKEEIAKNSVLVVCQRLPCVPNDFTIMAADVYDYGLRYNRMAIDRVMRVALEDTPLATLIPLIYGKMAFFMSVDFDPVQLTRAFKRLHYALPLAIVVDRQVIMSRSQVERLAKEAPKGVFNMHVQLSQALTQPISTLVSSFSHQLMQLTQNLQHLSANVASGNPQHANKLTSDSGVSGQPLR